MSDAQPSIRQRVTIGEAKSLVGEIPSYSEPLPVAEIMVDGIASAQFVNGVVKLTLFSEQNDVSTETNKRVVVGRIVMTTASAALVAQTIAAVMERLIEDGAVPRPPVEVVRA